MPENLDDPMTPAELRVVLRWLGLPHDWLAEHLKVQDRTIRRWLAGTTPIPDWARLAIEELEAHTAAVVTAAVDALNDARDPGLVTWRSDGEFAAAHPEVDRPVSWHHQVVARIANGVSGRLEIGYAGQGA